MFGMSSGLPTTMKGLWTSSLTKDTATMLSDLGLKPNVPTAIRIPLYGKSPEGKPLKEPFVLAVELTHEPCTTDCKVLVSRLKESLQLSGFPEQAALDETPVPPPPPSSLPSPSCSLLPSSPATLLLSGKIRGRGTAPVSRTVRIRDIVCGRLSWATLSGPPAKAALRR